MAELGRWARDAAAAGQPVLGVCFGHQLVGEALGGRAGRNPTGRETGTTEVHLTPEGRADPLFAGLPPVLAVQQTHSDALVVAPPDAVCLAGNASTPWQALAWGPMLRTVQFHPEMGAEALRELLAARGWPGSTRPTDHGLRVLANWAEHWLGLTGSRTVPSSSSSG
jgi:GMP synthase (glutamine-hydrolysing)